MDPMAVIATATWRDVLDAGLLSLALYWLQSWAGGARALKIALVLAAGAALFLLADHLDLFITRWVLKAIWPALLVLLVVLYQNEIKQGLKRFSPVGLFRPRRAILDLEVYEDLAQTAFDLARDRVGALVVLIRRDDPTEFIRGGQEVVADPRPDLLKSIFNTKSPAHDGAVLLLDGRIVAMGVVLPLTEREDLPDEYGTRHRAALGLSEKTDAVSLVVSEERGLVSLVCGRRVEVCGNPDELLLKLTELLGGGLASDRPWGGFSLTRNVGTKLAALGLAVVIWFFFGRFSKRLGIGRRLGRVHQYASRPYGHPGTGRDGRD